MGGDCYDWINLGSVRLALLIADVSGKGTPASLLMASVHASMQALAGTAAPTKVIERLNGFLFLKTQANKYVTLFYGELDVASGRLAYVNAGHVPPYRVTRDGTVSRLLTGGLALGILDDVSYEAGEVKLEPGDVVAMVTDGVTEANSPDEREFGDERVCEALCTLSGGSEGLDHPGRPDKRRSTNGRARGLQRRPDRPHPEGPMTWTRSRTFFLKTGDGGAT